MIRSIEDDCQFLPRILSSTNSCRLDLFSVRASDGKCSTVDCHADSPGNQVNGHTIVFNGLLLLMKGQFI